jgi:hypothetical protein
MSGENQKKRLKGRKPSGWEVGFYLICIPIGIFFSNSRHYVAILSTVGIGLGIGGLIGLCASFAAYSRLTPEEQREVDRAKKDERNVMIRQKASALTQNIMLVTLTVLALVFEILNYGDLSKLCAYLILWMGITNLIAFHLFRRRI